MRSSVIRIEKAVSPAVSSQVAEIPVREVMDIRQAASYLGVSADSLYRYASDGTIPCFRLGNRWRFKKSRLDSWMDEQSGPAKERPVRAQGKKPVRAAR